MDFMQVWDRQRDRTLSQESLSILFCEIFFLPHLKNILQKGGRFFFLPKSAFLQTLNQPLQPFLVLKHLFLGHINYQSPRGGGGGVALWANRPSNENAKVSKKLRPIAQNSGHVARSLEHQFFLSIIENYIRYSALHQIFCVKVPSSGCILFHN